MLVPIIGMGWCLLFTLLVMLPYCHLLLWVQVPMCEKYHTNLHQYLHFPQLKYLSKLQSYHSKLLQYWTMPPRANVVKLFTVVIYCQSLVMLFYNTEWWCNHGMAVNYHSKNLYNIGLRWCFSIKILFFYTTEKVIVSCAVCSNHRY